MCVEWSQKHQQSLYLNYICPMLNYLPVQIFKNKFGYERLIASVSHPQVVIKELKHPTNAWALMLILTHRNQIKLPAAALFQLFTVTQAGLLPYTLVPRVFNSICLVTCYLYCYSGHKLVCVTVLAMSSVCITMGVYGLFKIIITAKVTLLPVWMQNHSAGNADKAALVIL